MTQTACALLFAVTAFGPLAHAADPQPYRVEIASVGNGEMDAAIKATSDLQSLRGAAPVSPFGLIARARGDVDRLTTALESFGYYQCSVAIKINGMMVGNPGLADVLTALPKGKDAQVAISFTLGALYHLRTIDIEGDLPESVRSTLGLSSGEPAVAQKVLAGGSRLQAALQEQGHAFAQVDPPVAYEAADAPVLDLHFHVVAGPKVNIGQIHFEGLKRVHEPLLRARIVLHSGDPFRPSSIERARRDLLALGVFSQVSLGIGTEADDSGGVPITFKVRERLRHSIAVNAAYSSDLGGSGGVTWTDRNVFGNAQQLTIAASVINLGGSDTTGAGYDTSAKYIMPDVGRRDQSLQFTVGAIKQSLQAYDQTARTSSVTLTRKISSVWSVSVGGATVDEQIIQQSVMRNYTLLSVPLNVTFDTTHLSSPLEDPRRGIRASFSVTPTLALGNPNAEFIISQVKIAGFLDLNSLVAIDPGRTVLAARALAGLAQGAGEYSLPPDQRFYGGGSGTIRGYRYQSVGPQFPNTNTPIGGTAITAGSVELRQRIGTNFGAAVFADAGQVSASLHAVPDQFRIGVGAGIRYYTPIGPIRLDVAVPTQQRPGDDAFEIYIGLGQAF
ncbi:MAG TPA: BamA/TamA family outer membrane protein [Steroidobacteraceae bacterium]|nr:BamA/TamA family outer membrane protein [Steroidobacteraceae bacterium]